MPKAPRVLLTTRISPVADQWITDVAAEAGVTRADAHRAMLSVASKHPDEVTARLRGLSRADVIVATPDSK